MSLYKVPYTRILEINPHPNAERLELATLYGFQVVVQKDKYKAGSEVIFVPVDSVLPQWLENQIFPPSDKGKTGKMQRDGSRRIRQTRIRKFPSQGMVIDPQDLAHKVSKFKLEEDYAEKLEIVKYEPPFADHAPRGAVKRNKPKENPRFHQYKGLENVKWYPNLFKDGEQVVIQCKLHGTNARASIQPIEVNTLLKKIKKFFGMLPAYENCYGSNMVQLQERPGHAGYYGTDVYGAVFSKIDVFSKLKPGETVFGEIIGPGIQKGYTYGLKEHMFVLFDVKITMEDGTQEYLNPDQAEQFAKDRGFKFVPVLYRGPYSKEVLTQHVSGPSAFSSAEPIREGIVVKAVVMYGEHGTKKALKMINPDYLDTDPSDTH